MTDIDTNAAANWFMLEEAIKHDDIPAFKALVLNEGPDVREPATGRALLHLLAKKGRVQMASWLAKNPLDVNVLDKKGNSPLFEAARSGDVTMCKWLIQRGARSDLVNVGNNTPLHWAAQHHGSKVCTFLLKQEASGAIPVDAMTKYGYTALREAAEMGSVESCMVLLAAGADPDIRPGDGLAVEYASPEDEKVGYLTPFEAAIHRGHADVATLMREHCDIDPFRKSASGQTLLDLAKSMAVPAVLELVHSMMTEWTIRQAIPCESAAPSRRSPGPGIL